MRREYAGVEAKRQFDELKSKTMKSSMRCGMGTPRGCFLTNEVIEQTDARGFLRVDHAPENRAAQLDFFASEAVTRACSLGLPSRRLAGAERRTDAHAS
jgi:hypothetical protein